MSDKQTICVAVLGRPGIGKTTIAGLIAKTLHDKGFDVDVHLHDGKEDLHDSLTEAKVLRDLPTRVKINIAEAGSVSTLVVPESAQPKSAASAPESAIIPIFNEASKNYFIDTDGQGIDTLLEDGTAVQTLPLKLGKRFSLLGISSSAALLDKGVHDQTDSVSSDGLALGSLVFRTENGQFVAVPLRGTSFEFRSDTFGLSSRTKKLSIKTTVSIPLERHTLDIFGKSLVKPYFASVMAQVVVEGQISLDAGTTEVHGRGFLVESMKGGPNTPFAPPDNILTLEGYTLASKRYNPNRRPR